MTTLTQPLAERYEAFKTENPKTRIRDAAQQLGVSEAELVATGALVHRLRPDFPELLQDLQSLGSVMALTRNDHAVHERHGVYTNVSFEGPVGLVLNPDIDLRLFMMHWKYVFAVTEGDRQSLQFFDNSGEAIHKIYVTEHTDNAAYNALVEKYAATDLPEISTEAPKAKPAEMPDAVVNKEAFQSDWLALQDTHDFFPMLGKHRVSRMQALRLAPDGYARRIGNDASRQLLAAASGTEVPIMVFVGNRGCIQIHTGPVQKVMEAGPWYNVLDPHFNLHLRESAIAQTWMVRKPSVDGIVTSVEVFDEAGEMIVQFFGQRKPGQPEREDWRELVGRLN
ncbi:MAG: hemin-degrading factor [Sphingobacteriales bacterium]|nr:MAG: hemin-degrading factor [Sphingobacteriales bacterium]